MMQAVIFVLHQHGADVQHRVVCGAIGMWYTISFYLH